MASTNPATVEYEKSDLVRVKPLYRFIRACLCGPQAVKDGGELWLPHPDLETKGTKYGDERYASYKKRARFYNITGNTIKGMLGQVFSRDPVIKLPDTYSILLEDVTGTGVGLVQQAKEVATDVIGFGRHALLTDYSSVEGSASAADVASGDVRPFIMNFKPEDILNWRESLVGDKRRLTLLVLRDEVDRGGDDTFDEYKEKGYRELRLINGTFMARRWTTTDDTVVAGEWITPTKANGEHFSVIPAMLVGSDNNDPAIDDSPMADIAELNQGHYINSADYEESVFLLGQPTPVASGLDITWAKEIMGSKPIYLGSRELVKLPKGAQLDLLQIEGNLEAKVAMEHKESQMVALGARIVQNRDVQRTAKEYSGDRATQTSILATISRNVSEAYLQCLRWACEYSGDNPDEIEFELNTDFDLAKMSPEEVTAVMAAWQGKAISFTEMRFALKKGGVAFQEDEDARAENDSDSALRDLNLDTPEEDPNADPNADPAGNQGSGSGEGE